MLHDRRAAGFDWPGDGQTGVCAYCADNTRSLYYHPMAKSCTQCRTRQAMFRHEGGQLLCLNCYDQFVRVERDIIAYEMALADYLEEKIYFEVGLSSTPPRVPLPPQAPTRAIIQKGNITMNTINVDSSTIGILNTGHIENVRSIDLNITSMLRDGGTAAAAAAGLKDLTEAIAKSTEVSDEKKGELLDQVKMLSDEAARPVEQRTKLAIVKAVASGLVSGLSAAGNLAKVWSLCGPAICKHLGIDDPFSRQ